MQQAIAGIPGITAFFQPVQDIQIGTRISRTQFQYTLMDTDPAELALWAPRLLQRLASRCRRCERRHRPAERRLPHLHQRRSRRGDAARRVDAGDRGHAVRRVRPAADLHHLRPGQPVPRGAGSRSVLAGRSRTYLRLLRVPGAERRAGAAVRDRHDHAHRGAAGDHASGAVPVGDAQLRSGTRLFAGRCGAGDRRGREGHRHAGDHLRQLFRRRRGIPEVAAPPNRG